MRPILCVIDLGESSVKVVEVAAGMAHANKTHLTILFPYRLINHAYKDDMLKLKVRLEQEARDKFWEIQKQVPLLNQTSFEFHPEIGFAVDRINSHVTRNEVDMIVIGETQANMINEVNLTSRQNLIANSKTPFTIVPAETNEALSSHA